MAWQWTPYVIPLIVAVVVAGALATQLLRRRWGEVRARTGALVLLAGAVWTFGYALELTSAGLAAKLFWAKAQYLGIVLVPPAWLAYALHYTGRERWLTRRNLTLLGVVPLLTLALAFTNEAHGLMWSHAEWISYGSFSTLDQTFGPAFWVFLAYAIVVILLGLALLVRMFVRSPNLYRHQIQVLALAALILGMASVLDASGANPFRGLDAEPFMFAVIGPLVAWGLLRLGLGDIVPVANEFVIRGMSDGVVVLDARGRVLELNPAARELLGVVASDVVGRPVEQVCPKWPRQMQGPCQGNGLHTEVLFGEEDERRICEARASALMDGRGRPVSCIVVLRDITERKRTERELRERRRYLEAVLAAVPGAIVTLDAEHRVVEWNPGAERLFGYSRDQVVGRDIDHLVAGPEMLEEAVGFTRRAMGGRDLPPVETVRYRSDGEPVSVIVAASPIAAGDEVVGLVTAYTDITQRVEAVEALQRLNEELETEVAARTAELTRINAELLRGIEERERTELELLERNRALLSLQAAAAATASSLDLPFVLDTVTWEMAELLGVEGCIISEWNQEADLLFVLARYGAADPDGEELRGETYDLAEYPLRKRMLIERTGRQMSLGQSDVDPAEYVYMERAKVRSLLMLPMVFQDRVVGLVEMSDGREERAFTGQEVSMAQLLANQAAIAIENARLYERAQGEIAERMRAEERIATSLEEKVVLLKEIHHRVKNNLQVISSLLNLQSQNIKDRQALEVFRESQNRIRSMALIHEKLYRSHDLARIDFGEYVRSLASFLVRSYRAQAGPVNLRVDADGVALSIDLAVPCGLIVNELVSNALKYAFADGREGEIRVALRPDGDRRVMLMVADNGVGFPEDVDFRETESLGLQLVNTLCEQLGGTIELRADAGTEFRILFAPL